MLYINAAFTERLSLDIFHLSLEEFDFGNFPTCSAFPNLYPLAFHQYVYHHFFDLLWFQTLSFDWCFCNLVDYASWLFLKAGFLAQT